MTRMIIGPGKYIQGSGEMKRIAKHVDGLGESFFFLVSSEGLKRVEEDIRESFRGSRAKLVFGVFRGECSRAEIERVRALYREETCSVMVGIGGGKIIDTAKAVAFYERAPFVVAPTIASTDAPCSALSIIYSEEGIFNEILRLSRNPDIVVVDTDIIARAPVRLIVAGMGDALATYFETRACARSNAGTMAGGKQTLAAGALSELCYRTLLEDGFKAKVAVENHVVTPALENIIEANTYLSGIGFESGGLAAAHSIHNGLTIIRACRSLYHGEKVAFGTLAQLVLENAPIAEIREVLGFCRSVGLPVTLKDLGIDNPNPEELMHVAERSCQPGETIFHMPFDVTPATIYSAIVSADSLGKIDNH